MKIGENDEIELSKFTVTLRKLINSLDERINNQLKKLFIPQTIKDYFRLQQSSLNKNKFRQKK